MIKLIIIFFFQIQSVLAFNFYCNFEEVYSNGDTQQGAILIKKNKSRYEYFDQNLYTIIYANEKIFVIENQDRKKVQLVQNNNLLNYIIEIYNDYPNIDDTYLKNDFEIKVEKSSKNFIKRLIIKSKNLNMSIFFVNCKSTDLNDKLFNFKPFLEYVPSEL